MTTSCLRPIWVRVRGRRSELISLYTFNEVVRAHVHLRLTFDHLPRSGPTAETPQCTPKQKQTQTQNQANP